MTYNKLISWFLAISMLMFGILKFVNPFKGWYSIQITSSGLGQLSYIMGILGEIFAGSILILCLVYKHKIPAKIYSLLTNFCFFIIITIMLTGVFVHLHPNVGADVLPLKIKPPYLPFFFLLLAVSNIFSTIKPIRNNKTKKHDFN